MVIIIDRLPVALLEIFCLFLQNPMPTSNLAGMAGIWENLLL